MGKLNVSYYIPERLSDRIDERSRTKMRNKSSLVASDLMTLYDLIDTHIQEAVDAFTPDELHRLMEALKRVPERAPKKNTLVDALKPSHAFLVKIYTLTDLAIFALWDWSKTYPRKP